ncbi:helix-turn-helix domain-containing protein [Nocardia alni]|uniref:helix-turn-helix domain-containing protein n=1 Tax=Nocardia alni TaxID=2815723 RepID=UPI001C236ABD|nr:helix-turn-helix domain-containing protein [Nocardia alni]
MDTGSDGPKNRPDRKFVLDVTVPARGREVTDALRLGWDSRVGRAMPLSSGTTGADGYRVRIDHAKVDDAIIERLYSELPTDGAGRDFTRHDDRIVLHMVRRGGWRFIGPDHTVTVPAGQFLVRRPDSSRRFQAAPRTQTRIIALPAAYFRPGIGDRDMVGPSDSAEVRLLVAHTRMVEAMLDDLAPEGVRAARAALVELARGVLTRSIDADEPLLAPALIQAARDVVESLLTHPDLSPPVVARELNVSVRTLHRAFAGTPESVTGYIRRRRLERARLELAAHDSVSEIAARWQFTDSSHFARAFRNRYGQTPTQFARSIQAEPDAHGNSG